MNRRQFLTSVTTAGMVTLTGCSFQEPKESRKVEPIRVGVEDVVTGLDFPTSMTFTEEDHFLICERDGRIYQVAANDLGETPFLDLRHRLAPIEGERGLLGITAHPSYPENGRFFVRYSAPLPDGLPDNYSHTFVAAEFTARDDFESADPDSERRLLEIPQPGFNAQAGDLAFGPDGMLYIGSGDGGGRDNDPISDDWYWWNDRGGTSQDTSNLLGGILRIDVDTRGGSKAYGIPDENPLIGQAGRDEYYAWGFRNPYKLSFDRGRLFVADVGDTLREEVNVVTSGGNYGWPVKAGSTCTNYYDIPNAISENPLNVLHPKVWLDFYNRLSPYRICPDVTDSGEPLRDPVVEYRRTGSRAIIGGHVYRGDTIAELSGAYVFSDFVPPSPLLSAGPTDGGRTPWPIRPLEVEAADDPDTPESIVGFEQDEDGEIYILSTRFAGGSGRVRRLTAPT